MGITAGCESLAPIPQEVKNLSLILLVVSVKNATDVEPTPTAVFDDTDKTQIPDVYRHYGWSNS